LVNWWYGGKKKLKSLAIGQVWKPAAAGTTAGTAAALTDDDAATDTARAVAANSAAVAKAKATNGAKAQARAKPVVRRRNEPGSAPRKPGSSR
ncbi:MAG TPA: protein translocase subunit SecD, partial [Paraburkholderia sp.]|nr:protein translocase subunit SecD [Paraburkholderia sp.]